MTNNPRAALPFGTPRAEDGHSDLEIESCTGTLAGVNSEQVVRKPFGPLSAGLLTHGVKDWRSMVDDGVAIGLVFDGPVFRVALTDLPERKTDLVQGRYTLPAPKGKTTVTVKNHRRTRRRGAHPAADLNDE